MPWAPNSRTAASRMRCRTFAFLRSRRDPGAEVTMVEYDYGHLRRGSTPAPLCRRAIPRGGAFGLAPQRMPSTISPALLSAAPPGAAESITAPCSNTCRPASAVAFGTVSVRVAVPATTGANTDSSSVTQVSQPGSPNGARLTGGVCPSPSRKNTPPAVCGSDATCVTNESPSHGRLYGAGASTGVPALPGQPAPYG